MREKMVEFRLISVGVETILTRSTYKSSEASVTFGIQGIPLELRREPTILTASRSSKAP